MNVSVAGNYAKAFLEVAKEESNVTVCRDELQKLGAILNKDKRLMRLLEDPTKAFSEKWSLFYKHIDSPVSGLTVNFVRLLIGKKRVNVLPQIAGIFTRLSELSSGGERVILITARTLEFTERLEIERTLGRKFLMDYEVDPNIMAGVVMKKGSKMLDWSLRGRLENLKEMICR